MTKLNLLPFHNTGEYVFCKIKDPSNIELNQIILLFKEAEEYTVIIERELADNLKLKYSFVAAWITLSKITLLEETGITAVFSKSLSDAGISCNVVAAFNHDHIFVNKNDLNNTMKILNTL